ncbi:methyltransferase domain-containing protein [Patescibacteria group bacterium]|nr:methyltransferase domain-containing protein [Patescibacteria group bacterium]
MIKEKIFKNLVCLDCHKKLNLDNKKLVCSDCGKIYQIIGNKPYILDNKVKILNQENNDVIINKLKILFKKYPRIFSFLYYTFGASFMGKSAKKAIKNIESDKLIINLGSGIKKINDRVVNIDFYPFDNVDIVSDISRLPFNNNSVDAVINEFVLEHVKNPKSIVKEIHRILKPNGLLYLAVPFVASFHSSPNDYYRWSKQGIRELLKDFKEEEIGIRCGPTSAMLSVFNEWLAIVLSFGFRYLHQILLIIFTIITSPLKIIDYLIYKFPSSQNIVYGFYYIGKKK